METELSSYEELENVIAYYYPGSTLVERIDKLISYCYEGQPPKFIDMDLLVSKANDPCLDTPPPYDPYCLDLSLGDLEKYIQAKGYKNYLCYMYDPIQSLENPRGYIRSLFLSLFLPYRYNTPKGRYPLLLDYYLMECRLGTLCYNERVASIVREMQVPLEDKNEEFRRYKAYVLLSTNYKEDL